MIDEEQWRLKEESELRELHETVALDEAYFASYDLSGKGRDVHTTAKQRKIVQKETATIKFNSTNRRKIGPDYSFSPDREEGTFTEIDFNSKPRTFIAKGFLNRYEPDKILRKFVRRFLFVFNDVVLITIKKEGVEQYDVAQILWVKDLRIRHSFSENEEDKLCFELIVNQGKNRPRSTILFTCDDETSWRQWIEDLESTLLAFHRQTDLAKQLGWFHEVIQGNFHSAAYLGDLVLLRRHLKIVSIDAPDGAGMAALHWAVLRNHEVCVRFILDRGADVDVQQKGKNTPLLLAAACGHETIARLLIEFGADVRVRNYKGHDAVFMVVLYAHSSKGLPWMLQLLTSKGMDLNEIDSTGATPLHLCAEKNLARPVRLLVDSGADVNARHAKTQLTPIQMACSHTHPDMETIRSFLDKGAYPNWRDLQGRTAFDLALLNYRGNRPAPTSSTVSAVVFSQPGSEVDINELLKSPSSKRSTDEEDILAQKQTQDRWRPMEDTLNIVGDWAVKSLPALLELCKKGARFEMRDIETLRPSFRAAMMEAKEVWEKKSEPANFVDFVAVREQSGEDLRLNKTGWSKDKASTICQLCSDSFGLTNRRHHCRACGVLCCDKCSTKRLQLSSVPSTEQASSKEKKKDERGERACDGCFNRLSHEASLPSADHFRVRQLKQCALDVISSIEELIQALEDPSGDVLDFQLINSCTIGMSPQPSRRSIWSSFGSPSKKALPTESQTPSGENDGQDFVEVLKKREKRLHLVEDVLSKFLESAVGYHHITKRLIEQKQEKNRMYGSTKS